ncbi:hypothetical protein Tco_0758604 [Tanacetum coccineum]
MSWSSTFKGTIPFWICSIALLSISTIYVARTPAIAGKVPYLVALLSTRAIVVKMILGTLGQRSPIRLLFACPHIVDLGDILPLEGLLLMTMLSYAALATLTTQPACHLSLVSCLSSLGESLPSVPDAYAVAVSDVHGAETRVHIPAHGGSEAQNGLPESILSHEPKPLGKRKPPPPQSVWSPDELSYPP